MYIHNTHATEKVFPVLELPKEIDGALDPSLTSGLPTVVVRGFLNYMTIVDGVVIKFTKGSEATPVQKFPILLIPSSVESTTAIVKATNSPNQTDLILELNKKTGLIQVSQMKPDGLNSSANIQHTISTSTETSEPSLSATENLRVS